MELSSNCNANYSFSFLFILSALSVVILPVTAFMQVSADHIVGDGAVAEMDKSILEERAKIVLDKVGEVRKSLDEINSVLRDGKLSELIEKLDEYAKTLRYYINRDATEFSVRIHYMTDEDISVVVRRERYAYAISKLPRNVQLIEIYRVFFDNSDVLKELISYVVYVLVNIALEVSEKADAFRKLREVEAILRTLESEVKKLIEEASEDQHESE